MAYTPINPFSISSQYSSTPGVSGLVLPCLGAYGVFQSDQVCGDQRGFNSKQISRLDNLHLQALFSYIVKWKQFLKPAS